MGAPIKFWDRQGNPGTPYVEAPFEDDAETFLAGVPCFMDTDGYIREVPDGFGGSEVIYGISAEAAHNLTEQGTAEIGNEHGSPPGQSNAKVTALGSPTKDGRIRLYRDLANTRFVAELASGQEFSQTLIDGTTRYELDKVADGYWVVDSTDTGTSAKHAVHIVEEVENNASLVIIKFASAAVAA